MSEVSSRFGSGCDWSATPRRCKPTKTEPFPFLSSNIPFSKRIITLNSTSDNKSPTVYLDTTIYPPGSTPQPLFKNTGRAATMDPTPASLGLEIPHGIKTVSPLETYVEGSSAPFLDSDRSINPEGLTNTAPYNDLPAIMDLEPSPEGRSCDNSLSDGTAPSPKKTKPRPARRRQVEEAEPDSARAIYLERNRQAASRCRSKQKKQEEELVETARTMERKNKVLKAEVELLRSGVQELIDLAGQHSHCPDTRIKAYVQREADRLAATGINNPIPGDGSSGTSLTPEKPFN